MKALTLHNPKDLKYEEVQDPVLEDDWVLLRIKRVGICGTDKAFYKGTYKPGKIPIILGHEISGVVVDVGRRVSKDLIGLKVTSEINIPCRRCWFCRNNMYTHCPYRRVLGITVDGGMAEYMTTRSDVIHVVEDLSHEKIAFIEPLASVIEMIEMDPPRPFSNIAVIGVGSIGLLSIQVLKLFKPRRLIAVVRSDSPKKKLAELLGADEVVELSELREYIRRNTPEGAGFDYVVEATGDPGALDLAVDITRPRGVIASKSTHGSSVSFNYTSMIVKELKIVGSRCGPFDKAIDLLRSDLIKTSELVTGVYPLSRGGEAFERSFERDQIKIHLEP
ncbi:MAG: alcohol dehydrogenase catalytic domain-containing protein [Sulfolobales archaeon]